MAFELKKAKEERAVLLARAKAINDESDLTDELRSELVEIMGEGDKGNDGYKAGTLAKLEERIEAMSRPSQQTEDGQPPRTETRAPQVDRGEVELNKSVLQRIEEAGEDADDVEDVIEKITSDDVPISRAMRDYLGEAEKPYALAKWLTENPSEARKISRLSESVAVRALERREAELAKPATRKTTTAPPPVPTVGGRSAATFDPNTASMDEYAPHWHERQAKKQR